MSLADVTFNLKGRVGPGDGFVSLGTVTVRGEGLSVQDQNIMALREYFSTCGGPTKYREFLVSGQGSSASTRLWRLSQQPHFVEV